MKEVLVLGDGACPPPHIGDKDVVHLVTAGAHVNVRLQIDVFRTRFLRDLPTRLDDLLRLASFVYVTDTRVSRGSEKNVFGERWARRFHMVLPVWDLDFWGTPEVREKLAEILQFLTGDEYLFDFVQRSGDIPEQGIFQFKDLLDPLPLVDGVILFSGGIDSLAAVLEAYAAGHHPILVSHRSAPVIDNRQKHLADLVRKECREWAFPHISMWVYRQGIPRAEFSQRSRSFLYTSLGVVTAALLDIDDVKICDNGVVSINLPQSGQNLGTLLSRSTHPRYLDLIQEFMRVTTARADLSIRNTLLFKTKKETLDIIVASGHPALLQETVSCAHTERMTKFQPHCGVCSQCIDRRFASEAAALHMYDLVGHYKKDIFRAPLDEGTERTHAENYVRFALRLEGLQNPDAFFATFPELFDCFPGTGDVEAHAQVLWELFQRHQQTVNGVIETCIQKYAAKIRQAALPPTCLLRIVTAGQPAIDPQNRYIKRLQALLCKSLPPAFQTQQAKNERHVQDVGESVLQAAQEQLHRESPQISFATVTTKPDFSTISGHSMPLFVEFKYVKERRQLNKTITEMSSRVLIYRDQGAGVLFIVYDPKRTIMDDEKFALDFEKHERVWVGISR